MTSYVQAEQAEQPSTDERRADIPIRHLKVNGGLENPPSVEGDSEGGRGMSWNEPMISLADSKYFETLNGLWTGKKEPFVEAGVIRNTNFTSSGAIDFSNIAYLQVEEKQLSKRRLEAGDIIIERSGGGPKQPVGRVVFFDREDGDFSFSNFTSAVRVKDKTTVDPHFVFYGLMELYQSGQTEDIQRRTTGIRNLDFTAYKERARFPKIAFPEQKKIAYILSTVQRAIEAQERIIQTTMELKKALMHKLFTDGLRNEPQKQTEIGLVPESWETRKLGDIATMISKGSSPKWQGFHYTENGILFVRSQNVGAGKMLLDSRAYLPATFNDKEKRSILQSGDILINLVGASIGRVALGTAEILGGNCNQAVGFVRLEGSKALKQLIVYFLLSPWGQEQMRRQKKDIARANLSLLDLRGFEIPIPPTEEEIEDVANALVTLEEKVTTHELKRDRLQDLFRTLLHELMTAKIRVHEIDLEKEVVA